MTHASLWTLPALILICATDALADPPVAATIAEPAPVAATIAQPTITVSPASVNGAPSTANYGSLADSRIICKTEVPIGSRLGGHQECKAKRDWEAQSRANQDYMDVRIGASANGPR